MKDDCRDVKSLAERLAEEYELGPRDADLLEADVQVLMQSLIKAGVVRDVDPDESAKDADFEDRKRPADIEKVPEVPDEGAERWMEIAGIMIRFRGKAEHFSESFEPFCLEGSRKKRVDISIQVTETDPPDRGVLPFVLRGMTVTVRDGGDFYIMRSSETPAMKGACIQKDGSRAVIYVEGENPESPVQKRLPAGENGEAVTAADCIFHAVRHAFLLKAQKMGMYVIHSASILHNGRAWLFSALSGTGKSTHTNIWHKLYGTPYLDGDLNLMAFEDGRPVVKGIPWCGTSGIFTTKTYPLGGIMLLARSPQNYVEEMKKEAQILGIQMRFISPKWTAEQAAESLDFAEKIAKNARIARLHCNMEDEAAEVCRAWIDGSNKK